ncbi:eukaryotic translation initiation factor 2-alpha kinase [Cydia strobilella]|uniref:eukaryotic translation initiation factor 2-alpha kinase n=1 Tax=Cydia strobilella TaxID=1100964 RepID=UPI003003AE4C
MSEWYWKVIALKAAFVLTCFVSSFRAEETVHELPFCNPHYVNTDKNDLMIVSTLDGKLTAFSTADGSKAWEIETQPLLSSNLHHVELTAGGKWVRLVPSLRGTLYSLSGDNIEPLPFDADQLLSSSFKYSEDLVIAGAKETVWQGIDTTTGSVLYECGSAGCSSEQQATAAGRHVLVLRRHANTVRALDPRSGQEKWNFSVAEHQLALSVSPDCLGPATAGAGQVAVHVAMPEGTVGVARPGETEYLWQQQLESPVAGMWRLQAGALKTIDVLWECTRALTDDGALPPQLYIGVHRTQLYIQESHLYVQKLESSVAASPIPWKLKQSRPLLNGGDTALSLQDPPANSLVTLYTAPVTSNHGFFLYLQETCDQAVQVTEDFSEPPPVINEHHHIHVHVSSLWFWWKEVLLIAVSSALLMNLMIWPRFFAPKFRPHTPMPVDQEVVIVERHYDRPPSTGAEYSGRYENDFTPLRCLGQGGFGVVFEAKNNIDHCSYAVKRITLPRRESERERVLREVRALAKLEHENIVRYFNSWVEEPPPNWQEQRDALWKRELNVSVEMSEDYTVESPTPVKRRENSIKLNLHKMCDGCGDSPYFEKRNRSLSCNESFSIIFDEQPAGQTPTLHTPPKSTDDSFIVFANEDEVSKVSEARRDGSIDKRLERVKESDSYVKSTSSTGKKKKGHTRHWSLDMVVRESVTPMASKMYLYIQMQLCMRDSLHDWLRQNRTRESRADKIKTLFSQIVSAVEYVHLAGLIHRDLKPSNILFAPDGRVKVGDFGLVTTMGDSSSDGSTPEQMDVYARHTYKVGTRLYMSPEQLAERPYSYKVDIYSLGVILFELLQPFDTESERVAKLTALRAAHYPADFIADCPSEVEVLKLMLSEDPSRRPTASGVRARAPLHQRTDDAFHFTLPPGPGPGPSPVVA